MDQLTTAVEIGDMTPAALAALIGLVHKHTGIAMTERKSILLQGRLRPRLRALSLHSYEDYFKLVEQRDAEVQLFINMVTTNDTAFFRTPHVWDFFKKYLSSWSVQHPGKTLKIWSAAAASGEEAYSMAMLCQEFQRTKPGFQYQILATDISSAVIATAQTGLYGGRSIERVKVSHPTFYAQYFTSEGNNARLDEGLKKHIRFAEHNLLQPLKTQERFDLVFLRNVLIYFEEDHQKKVVDLLRQNMVDEAKLILGESESLNRINTCYVLESPLVYTIRSGAV
jgi:chemotaxis protein methyltransferase CheR